MAEKLVTYPQERKLYAVSKKRITNNSDMVPVENSSKLGNIINELFKSQRLATSCQKKFNIN